MGRHLSIGAAALLCVFFLGCAKQQNGGAGDEFKVEFAKSAVRRASVPENDPKTGQELVKKAQSAIGTPYVYGGERPGGFDCSGLVKWAYNSVGVTLPRTAREQSVVGQKVNDVEDMRAGDIVAFRHPKRGYHTGIYLGDGKFIHSPRRRTHVRINSLSDPYFSKTLLGARRVNMASGENLVAQANERLDKMIAEATNLTLSSKTVRARKAQSAHNLLASTSKKTAGQLAAKSKKQIRQTAAASKGVKAAKGKGTVKASAKNAAKAPAQKLSAKNAAKAPAKAAAQKAPAKTVASAAKKGAAKQAPKKQDAKTVSINIKKAPKQARKRGQS